MKIIGHSGSGTSLQVLTHSPSLFHSLMAQTPLPSPSQPWHPPTRNTSEHLLPLTLLWAGLAFRVLVRGTMGSRIRSRRLLVPAGGADRKLRDGSPGIRTIPWAVNHPKPKDQSAGLFVFVWLWPMRSCTCVHACVACLGLGGGAMCLAMWLVFVFVSTSRNPAGSGSLMGLCRVL